MTTSSSGRSDAMPDPMTDRLRTLVREAVGEARMAGAPPLDGLGGVIISAPESGQALLWIRAGAGDESPALIQAMVPFDDRPVDASDEAVSAAVQWLEGQRGRWAPMDAP